jgi:hypothetical protein
MDTIKNLYGWLFTYNPFTNKWYAANRDNYSALFSDLENKNVLSSSSFETLREIIVRTNGNKNEISKLLNRIE